MDHTLERINDWSLQAEIEHFRTLRTKVAVLREEARLIRRELTVSSKLQDSIDRLSQCDAYARLQGHLKTNHPTCGTTTD